MIHDCSSVIHLYFHHPLHHPHPSLLHFQSEAARLAPWALATHHTLELNRMYGTDESLRQVYETERTRGVCMAQQETVALAQILKVSSTFFLSIHCLVTN